MEYDHLTSAGVRSDDNNRTDTRLDIGNAVMVLFSHSLSPYQWGSPIFPLVVHQPASVSIWPAFPFFSEICLKSYGDNVLRMWVQLKRSCVLCMVVLQRGLGGDGCDLASTLCKYDLRKDELFVFSWARVRRVRWESISSELLM